MGLDLRIPIGMLFLAYGLILGAYGLMRPQDVQGLNVNLIWGGVMAAFGAVMLVLSRTGGPAPAGRAQRPERSPTPTGN